MIKTYQVFLKLGAVLLFTFQAPFSMADFNPSMNSLGILKSSAAAALGLGSVQNGITYSIDCTIGLNLSKTKTEMKGVVLASSREEAYRTDYETRQNFSFQKNDCSSETKRDTSGNAYLYTTCLKRKETFCSRFWNKDIPRIIVEKISFRKDFQADNKGFPDAYPVIDYSYIIQDEDSANKSSHVVFKKNCFAPFYPTKKLHEVLNF